MPYPIYQLVFLLNINTMKTTIHYITLIAFVLLFTFSGCKKDEVTANETDVELYSSAKITSGFTWYKNSDALLPKSNLSGHSEAFLRTRFNTIASSKLDGSSKVQAGITFPEGSLIVKELYSNQTTLSKYAILFKDSDHEYADSNGWVWGYVNADGSVVTSSSDKGSSCIACHSQNGNINGSLMNVAFP